MTTSDWINLGLMIASFAISAIAGIYTKNKSKINHSTRAGQALDVLGKLATNAVHEAESLDMEDSDKRKYASDTISEQLNRLGFHNITSNTINGAIESAVNAMHLANADYPETGTAKDVDSKNLYTPADQSLGDHNE